MNESPHELYYDEPIFVDLAHQSATATELLYDLNWCVVCGAKS